MKIFCAVVLCAFYIGVIAEDEKYPTKHDSIDIDRIIGNQRLLNNYVNCLLGKTRCTKEGEDLKRILPDALKTNCSKCSEAQKTGAKKVIRYLISNRRDYWDELEAKYDPTGTYRKQYEEEIKREGIKI